MTDSTKLTNLFVSYSRVDAEYLHEFIVHLKPLAALIDVWSDEFLAPGMDRREAILRALAEADIVAFLLTPDFFASEDCVNVELHFALERSTTRRIRIVPILVRACSWADTPLKDTTILNAGHPIASHDKRAHRDHAWKNAAQHVRTLVAGPVISADSSQWNHDSGYSKQGGESVTIWDSNAELIDLLEDRARNIATKLSGHYKCALIDEYLAKFNALHARHVEAIRKRQMIRAHEILSEIHRLSFELEKSEFWTRHRIESPGVSYRLAPDAFDHGPIVTGYLLGDASVSFVQRHILLRFFPQSEKPWSKEVGTPAQDASTCYLIMLSATRGDSMERIAAELRSAAQPKRKPMARDSGSAPRQLRQSNTPKPRVFDSNGKDSNSIREEFREKGYRCPHCHSILGNVTVRGAPPYFYVCTTCGRSFDDPDLPVCTS